MSSPQPNQADPHTVKSPASPTRLPTSDEKPAPEDPSELEEMLLIMSTRFEELRASGEALRKGIDDLKNMKMGGGGDRLKTKMKESKEAKKLIREAKESVKEAKDLIEEAREEIEDQEEELMGLVEEADGKVEGAGMSMKLLGEAMDGLGIDELEGETGGGRSWKGGLGDRRRGRVEKCWGDGEVRVL
jgi:predicted RNase H-like nuclease (RuvC/YqgF family)